MSKEKLVPSLFFHHGGGRAANLAPRGVPAWGVGYLALVCVFVFHLLVFAFHWHFLALGGGLG